MKKIFIFTLFIALSLTQVRVSFEANGRFNNDLTSPGVVVGYEHYLWDEQDNISAGIGAEFMVRHNGYRETPDGMGFNSLYIHFNYGFTEEWNGYSKIGFCDANDYEDFFDDDRGLNIGLGVSKGLDTYNIGFGYHVTFIDQYSYDRIVLSFIRILEDDDK